MLVWKDIGFKKNETGRDHERVSDLSYSYARRIGRPVSELRTSDEIKSNVRDKVFRVQ